MHVTPRLRTNYSSYSWYIVKSILYQRHHWLQHFAIGNVCGYYPVTSSHQEGHHVRLGVNLSFHIMYAETKIYHFTSCTPRHIDIILRHVRRDTSIASHTRSTATYTTLPLAPTHYTSTIEIIVPISFSIDLTSLCNCAYLFIFIDIIRSLYILPNLEYKCPGHCEFYFPEQNFYNNFQR